MVLGCQDPEKRPYLTEQRQNRSLALRICEASIEIVYILAIVQASLKGHDNVFFHKKKIPSKKF